MKIRKLEKLEINPNDEEECVIHMRNLKQTLNHGLVLKKVHRINKFNQKAGLKLYIDISEPKFIKQFFFWKFISNRNEKNLKGTWKDSSI